MLLIVTHNGMYEIGCMNKMINDKINNGEKTWD